MISPPFSAQCVLVLYPFLVVNAARVGRLLQRSLYAEDGALQFDLRVGGVVASIVDDGLIVELEIADVADDEVVVCPGGRC